MTTTTRPERSPNFSPSLVKTSSMRRWMAHCWLERSLSALSVFGGSERAGSGRGRSGGGSELMDRADTGSDARPRRQAGGDALGLVEHALLDEDRRLGPDGEGD